MGPKPMKVKLTKEKITLTDLVYGAATEDQRKTRDWHLNHDVSYYFSKRKEDKKDNADK